MSNALELFKAAAARFIGIAQPQIVPNHADVALCFILTVNIISVYLPSMKSGVWQLTFVGAEINRGATRKEAAREVHLAEEALRLASRQRLVERA